MTPADAADEVVVVERVNGETQLIRFGGLFDDKTPNARAGYPGRVVALAATCGDCRCSRCALWIASVAPPVLPANRIAAHLADTLQSGEGKIP